MTFSVNGTMGYNVTGSATLITSLHCMQTQGQAVANESFVTSRPCQFEELAMGLGMNRFARIGVAEAGAFEITYSANVTQSSRVVSRKDLQFDGAGGLPAEVIPYLFPSRYCQSDILRGRISDLIRWSGNDYDKAEAVANWIRENVSYISGSTGEQTSAVDVLESRQGVCRDFAHLGIAMCRALTLPARYATVYAYQLQPQDFHAVFEVFLHGAWYLFDATGLAPLNGMVRISTGRDASDAALASLFGSVVGNKVQVDCRYQGQDFEAVTRESLQNLDSAFILG